MKRFDEWLKTFYENHRGNMRYEPMAKQGWKAALKWVLSIDSGFCSCGRPNDIWQEDGVLDKIEKELKED